MALIEPSYDEVVELTPGVYQARLTEYETKISQKGATYLKWKLEVENNNNDPKLNGRTVKLVTMITGPGAGNLRNLIKATLNSNYEQGPFDPDDIVGKSVMIVVKDGIDRVTKQKTGFPEVATVSRLTGETASSAA